MPRGYRCRRFIFCQWFRRCGPDYIQPERGKRFATRGDNLYVGRVLQLERRRDECLSPCGPHSGRVGHDRANPDDKHNGKLQYNRFGQHDGPCGLAAMRRRNIQGGNRQCQYGVYQLCRRVMVCGRGIRLRYRQLSRRVQPCQRPMPNYLCGRSTRAKPRRGVH